MTTKKAHTEYIKVNLRLIQLIRIAPLDFTAVSSSHHLIVQPSWCFYGTLFLTQQGRSSKLAARAGFAIARSGFELFRLCHGYDVMGIRSCELSEPLTEIG